jgi:hypothetical protein
MTHSFSDELLSAYLDDELSSGERDAVEAHLATSPADRELLEELRSLRGELQLLPATAASAGFADRVVAAAVAAKGRATAVTVTPATPAAPAIRKTGRWVTWSAAALLASAAAIVLIVGPWRGENAPLVELDSDNVDPSNLITPAVTPLADQIIAQLRSAVPGEGEAVVLRLRVSNKTPLGQSLDMALAEAGIFQRPASDTASGAVQVGAAYRNQILQQHGITQPGPPSPELLSSTVAAAEAVFVEASLAQLEQALAALSSDPARSLELAAETKLAIAMPIRNPGEGEGESGSASAAAQARAFCQRLNAGMFRLMKRDSASNTPVVGNASTVGAQGPLRVLILVEHIE